MKLQESQRDVLMYSQFLLLFLFLLRCFAMINSFIVFRNEILLYSKKPVLITRIEYTAYLHYLLERNNNRNINWDSPVFQRYLEWQNSKSGVAQPVDFELESNRKNFA